MSILTTDKDVVNEDVFGYFRRRHQRHHQINEPKVLSTKIELWTLFWQSVIVQDVFSNNRSSKLYPQRGYLRATPIRSIGKQSCLSGSGVLSGAVVRLASGPAPVDRRVGRQPFKPHLVIGVQARFIVIDKEG